MLASLIASELRPGSTVAIGPFGPKELCYNELRPEERWIVFARVSLDTRIPEDWYQARQRYWLMTGEPRTGKPRYRPPPSAIRIHAEYSNGPFSAARPFTQANLDQLAACDHVKLLF